MGAPGTLKSLAEVEKLDFDSLLRFLRQARELRTTDAEAVARYGSCILRKYSRKLTRTELWLVHEQAATAAMEIGNHDLALSLISNIHATFPKGVRASRIAGMLGESGDRMEEARKLYDTELETDPQNALILKRKVAMLKADGDLPGAVTELRAYLTINQMDWVAWEEAAELYILLQLYHQAAFCLEEVLMHQPVSVGTHLTLADVLCTQGGTANLISARSHYSAVVELTGGKNVRALYGLTYVAAMLAGEKKGAKTAGPAGEELATAAAQKLTALYATEASEPARACLAAMLRAQGVGGKD